MNLQAEELQILLAPALASMECQLWGVEVIPQHHPLLRIYIDGLNSGAITIGQIGQASHKVIDALRLAGVNTELIHLEVSSPGVNRRLFTLAQCEALIGKEIAVKLRQSLLGRQKYKGVLTAVKGNQLSIQPSDSEQIECPWDLIARANVVADLQTYLTSEKKK